MGIPAIYGELALHPAVELQWRCQPYGSIGLRIG